MKHFASLYYLRIIRSILFLIGTLRGDYREREHNKGKIPDRDTFLTFIEFFRVKAIE